MSFGTSIDWICQAVAAQQPAQQVRNQGMDPGMDLRIDQTQT